MKLLSAISLAKVAILFDFRSTDGPEAPENRRLSSETGLWMDRWVKNCGLSSEMGLWMDRWVKNRRLSSETGLWMDRRGGKLQSVQRNGALDGQVGQKPWSIQ